MEAMTMEAPSASRDVTSQVRRYLARFGREDAELGRRREYVELVNGYYDLVTDFYERGWGDSFHFAPARADESFEASLLRHEHYLALRLGIGRSMRVLDVGCGVGGPMRAIAGLTGARVDGINNHAEQLQRLAKYNARAGLSDRCRGVRGDFMALPFADASYDAAYAIEATCHAPDRTALFRGIHRVLRPGAGFAGYEWVTTDRFDPSDAHHQELAERIIRGNGLPHLTGEGDVRSALEKAGFEVVEMRDLAREPAAQPWYAPLTGRVQAPARLNRHPLVRPLISPFVRLLEQAGVAPEGTWRVSALLQDTADALVEAGELGLFTPCLFFLATKRG